ncbi:protein arginine N-methyltransferase 5 [Skeletonema marinoi]|uniref:Protein arginine N-methyltransferase 5 n=1 Tax=Skeletonema marinoi TaxID=267567 RepID=A0AAD8YGB4_9STRA|nr:protein arginine N-methyltransferase 5 [Skeletonema marinoi]
MSSESITLSTTAQSTAASSQQGTSNMICGVSHPENSRNAFLSLQDGRRDGFDYVVTELPVPIGIVAASAAAADGGGVSMGSTTSVRTDVTRMDSRWWSTSVVGIVGDPPHWKTAASTKSTTISSDATGSQLMKALTSSKGVSSKKKQEADKIFWGMLEWASHMCIPAVILPTIPLSDGDSTTEVKISSSDEEDMFDDAPHDKPPQDQAKTPQKKKSLSINSASAKEYARLISQLSTSSICSTSRVQLWIRVPLTLHHLQAYQLLLARCDHSPSVGCMLSITSPLDATELPAITRALHTFMGGGHVKGISWDVSAFLKNKRGYPTLSKSHQYLFQLVYGRLGRTLRTLVEGGLPGELNHEDGGSPTRRYHLQYLAHLRSRAPLPSLLDSEEAVLETPYLDNLQSPLQPLGDHLEYQTYETFEKDPVKYKRYGEAVELALEDGMKEGKFPFVKRVKSNVSYLRHIAAGEDGELGLEDLLLESANKRDGAIVEVDLYEATIFVVGAGRGPLVHESIAAVSRVASSLLAENKALIAKVVAIEKNPSAVLYLQSLKSTHRSWNGGEEYAEQLDLHYPHNCGNDIEFMIQNEECRADIVVSELLGSFGDNELSQNVWMEYKDVNYTAFIAPVSSSRLYSEARCQSSFPAHPEEGPAAPASGMQRALETPDTTTRMDIEDNTSNKTNASAEAAMKINNDRHAHISFRCDPMLGASAGCGYGALNTEIPSVDVKVKEGCEGTNVTIHGFLGSFHSVLYESPSVKSKVGKMKQKSSDGIRLSVISIAPNSFSVGMFSWFPLYFPLKQPLCAPEGSTVNCSVWRRSDDARVWYEWCAEVIDNNGNIWSTSSIHNPGGRSYHVRL